MSVTTNLPPEILEHIFSHLAPSSQQTFHGAALVARAWYATAVKYLYHSPILVGRNFDLFVRSVCPSINAHVRYNGLANLIRKLDMSGLVHDGSRSLTARLIGRVKHNLDEFIAPQASFGVNSLAAISKCIRLRCLDLGFVSEAIPMSDLLRSVQGLDQLVLLYLPRASSYAASKERTAHPWRSWPPRLRELHLNGGFSKYNLPFLLKIPPTTSHLWLTNCPPPAKELVTLFFNEKGPQLETLHVALPRRRQINVEIMFAISRHCTQVRNLSLNIELIGANWSSPWRSSKPFYSFPCVERLEVGCLEGHESEYVEYVNHMSAYLYSEKLPKLRKLLIHRDLRWTSSEASSQQVAEMNDLLKAMAREDGEDAEIPEHEAGVILFG